MTVASGTPSTFAAPGTMAPNFSRPLATITKPCPTRRLCNSPPPPARSRSQTLRPSSKFAERIKRAVSLARAKDTARHTSRTQSREHSPSYVVEPDGLNLSELPSVHGDASGSSDSSSRTPDTPSSAPSSPPSSTRSADSTYQSPASSANSSPIDSSAMVAPPPLSNQTSTNPPLTSLSSTYPPINQTFPFQQNSFPVPTHSAFERGHTHSRLAWLMAAFTVISTVFTVGSFVLQAISNGNSGNSRRSIGTRLADERTIILVLVLSVVCLGLFGTMWLLPQSRPRSNSAASIAMGDTAANLAKQAPSIPKPSDVPLLQYYLSILFKKETEGTVHQQTSEQYKMKLHKIDMNWFSFLAWLVNGEPSNQGYRGFIMDRNRAEQLERVRLKQEEWCDPKFRYADDDTSFHLDPKSKDLRMHEEYSVLSPGPETLGDGVRRRNSYTLDDEPESGSPFGFKDRRMMEGYE